MSLVQVTIATYGDPGRAEGLRGRLLSAWPHADLPSFVVVAAGAAVPEELVEQDAVVLVADGAAPEPDLLSLLSRLQDHHVPTLVIVDGPAGSGSGYELAGAVVHDLHLGSEVLAASLHAVAHRQRTVRMLRAEAALADRYRGGLSGQMAKMHEELQLAAVVQREFLPRPQEPLHGVECAALWRPTHYVSGDLYDIIRLDEDHLGLFLADCVGHGVPAALMTMVVHRALCVKQVSGKEYRLLPPSEVLARLNADLIRRQGPSTRFVTAVYAVLDCVSRRITISAGGHPPPIVLAADGSTRLIEKGGGLIGVFSDEQYPQEEFTLSENDRLLIYSDGFEQAFPDVDADPYTRRIPTQRYLEEFETLRSSASSLRMIEELARRLNDQHGSLHQADDLTMLCVRAGAMPNRAAVVGTASVSEPSHAA